MRTPASVIVKWASSDDALLETVEANNIRRTLGLRQDWAFDLYPSAGLFNQILAELYASLVDWQMWGILPYDPNVSDGYATGAVIIDGDGLLRQAKVADAHLVNPTEDVRAECWSYVDQIYEPATYNRFGYVRIDDGDPERPTNRQLISLDMYALASTPASVRASLVAGIGNINNVDGVCNDIELGAGILTVERTVGVDLTENISSLMDGYARLASPRFTGNVLVPNASANSNSQVIANTRWVRLHDRQIIGTASDTRAGLFRYATRSEVEAGTVDHAVNPSLLAHRLTRPFGMAGERGDAGIQTIGPPGFRGLQGLKGEKGDQGDRGDRGLPGLSLPGQRGLKGEKGDRGDRGTRGTDVTGPKGEKGDRGDPGESGIFRSNMKLLLDGRIANRSNLNLHAGQRNSPYSHLRWVQLPSLTHIFYLNIIYTSIEPDSTLSPISSRGTGFSRTPHTGFRFVNEIRFFSGTGNPGNAEGDWVRHYYYNSDTQRYASAKPYSFDYASESYYIAGLVKKSNDVYWLAFFNRAIHTRRGRQPRSVGTTDFIVVGI